MVQRIISRLGDGKALWSGWLISFFADHVRPIQPAGIGCPGLDPEDQRVSQKQSLSRGTNLHSAEFVWKEYFTKLLNFSLGPFEFVL
jgi:hypothetical protein